VDDVRLPPSGWRLARTIEEAVRILSEGGVEELSLDYVIGDDPGRNFAEVARRVADLPEASRPRVVHIHTSSSHGARVLQRLLQGVVRDVRFGPPS
jgi:deoxyxylulose-5-phosphate synthase